MKRSRRTSRRWSGTRLHVLVATHRHADHISGFATNKAKTGTGDIIAGLEPQLVVQPWTERPDAPEDFIGTGSVHEGRRRRAPAVADADERGGRRRGARGRQRHLPAAASERDSVRRRRRRGQPVGGEEPRRDGQEDARPRTCSTGRRSRRSRRCCRASRSRFWARRRSSRRPTSSTRSRSTRRSTGTSPSSGRFARGAASAAGRARRCFPTPAPTGACARSRSRIAGSSAASVPCAREQLLGLVRSMDDALNNTSVILLFEAGGKKLLFPGDAQWENWELALTQERRRR